MGTDSLYSYRKTILKRSDKTQFLQQADDKVRIWPQQNEFMNPTCFWLHTSNWWWWCDGVGNVLFRPTSCTLTTIKHCWIASGYTGTVTKHVYLFNAVNVLSGHKGCLRHLSDRFCVMTTGGLRPAAIVWRNRVDVYHNLRDMFMAPCRSHARKTEGLETSRAPLHFL